MPKEGRQGKKARKETRGEDEIEQNAVSAQSRRSTGGGGRTGREGSYLGGSQRKGRWRPQLGAEVVAWARSGAASPVGRPTSRKTLEATWSGSSRHLHRPDPAGQQVPEALGQRSGAPREAETRPSDVTTRRPRTPFQGPGCGANRARGASARRREAFRTELRRLAPVRRDHEAEEGQWPPGSQGGGGTGAGVGRSFSRAWTQDRTPP